jgi:hypothetical protein
MDCSEIDISQSARKCGTACRIANLVAITGIVMGIIREGMLTLTLIEKQARHDVKKK